MDPLSLAVSILSLAKAAEKTGSLMHKVLTLRKYVSETTQQLNNEMSLMRVLIRNISSALIDLSDLASEPRLSSRGRRITIERHEQAESLQLSLEMAKAALLEMEEMLVYDLSRAGGGPDHCSWLRRENRVKKLQKNMQNARHSLTQSMEVLNLSNIHNLELISLDLHSAATETTAVLQMNESVLKNNQEALRGNQTAMKELIEQVTAVSESTRRIEANAQTQNKTSKTSADRRRSSGSSDRTRPIQPSYGMMAFRLAQRAECSRYCSCSCHREAPWTLPSMIQPIFGKLCASYFGLPALPEKTHSDSRCKSIFSSGLHVTYLLPTWLFARALSITAVQNVGGINMDFRVHNVRPDTDEAFRLAQDGDTEGLRQLMCKRRASVLDITHNNGHSLLHTALRYSRIETASYLVKMGAEKHFENDHGETAYAQAWNNIFYFQDTPREVEFEVERLLELFPDEEDADEQRGFTMLHRLVLGLQYGNFEEVVRENRSLIDMPDGEGKTPLYWAAARGDVNAVRTLIWFGADPNRRDSLGQGPLRASLKAVEPDCMELLLEAKATVDLTDNWKQTCLIAAHYYPRPELFVKHLVRYRANVDARDFRGDSALIKTVKGANGGYGASALMLIEAGADINLQNKAGHTVIHAAIMANAHKVLRATLTDPEKSRKPNLRLTSHQGETFLHFAASHGDVHTLKILTSFPWKFAPNVNHERHDSLTPLDLIDIRRQKEVECSKDDEQRRFDVSIWEDAWQDLLSSFNKAMSVATTWSFVNGMIKRVSTGSTSYSPDSPRTFHTAFSDFAPL